MLDDILVKGIPTQRDVVEIAVTVGHHGFDQTATEICDVEFDAIGVCQAPKRNLLALKATPRHLFN